MCSLAASPGVATVAVVALGVFAACDPSDRASNSDLGGDPEIIIPSTPDLVEGRIVAASGPLPGAIAGLHYRSASAAGFTDAFGTFSYGHGESVTFAVGDIEIATLPGAPRITVFALGGGADCAVGATLPAVLVLIMMLDADLNLDNGISLPAFTAAGPARRLADLSEAQLYDAIAALAPGVTVLSHDNALDRFITHLDGETWALAGGETFGFPTAAARSQGVATDGTGWFFSWTLGLERTDAQFNTAAQERFAIPSSISAQGGDHIGDIDYAGGLIYAPIEDSGAYAHPLVALYNATTLDFTDTAYELPQNLHTKGVPWVAVDEARGRVYTAEWDPTAQINVFDLNASLALVTTLPLHTTLGRLQGAKVLHGMLYASSDNAQKSIYKINLDTGTVIELFAFGPANVEMEGLVVGADVNGAWMRVLIADAGNFSVDLRTLRRTLAPLRDTLCP